MWRAVVGNEVAECCAAGRFVGQIMFRLAAYLAASVPSQQLWENDPSVVGLNATTAPQPCSESGSQDLVVMNDALIVPFLVGLCEIYMASY